jgi:hypothetical protein
MSAHASNESDSSRKCHNYSDTLLGAAVRVGVGMGGVEKLDEDDVVGGPLGRLVAHGMAGPLLFNLSAIVGVIGRGGAGSVRPRRLDGARV